MSQGDNDSFWKDSGCSVVDHLEEYEDVPEYHTTGWYDSWATQVANLNFAELRRTKKSLRRFTVGPWIHSSEGVSHAGEEQFTEDAALNLREFHLRWFDHCLKGIDNGVDREAPVCIYVMGGGDGHKTPESRIFVGGHWREEQEWPLARAVASETRRRGLPSRRYQDPVAKFWATARPSRALHPARNYDKLKGEGD